MTVRPRVLHVVTLVSPDGAYGGPVRVAVNQAAQQRAEGAEVTIAAGVRGFSHPPSDLDGVPVWLARVRQLVPGQGFAGLVAPGVLRSMASRRHSYDVVHVHLARDLVTIPAALLAILLGKRLIVQTHGMVAATSHRAAPLMDFALTRPILRRAAWVLYLSAEEGDQLRRVEPTARLVEVGNGVPVPDPEQAATSTTTVRPEALFLARLHLRKRPQIFVEAAQTLLTSGCDATFALVGPDEGEGPTVRRAIERGSRGEGRIEWEGPLAPGLTTQRIRRCAVYVLPSVDEPAAMAVLEAMAVGKPVIITRSNTFAPVVESAGCGIVVDDSLAQLVVAMRELLTDRVLREAMGQAAAHVAATRFGMSAVTGRLAEFYGSAV